MSDVLNMIAFQIKANCSSIALSYRNAGPFVCAHPDCGAIQVRCVSVLLGDGGRASERASRRGGEIEGRRDRGREREKKGGREEGEEEEEEGGGGCAAIQSKRSERSGRRARPGREGEGKREGEGETGSERPTTLLLQTPHTLS